MKHFLLVVAIFGLFTTKPAKATELDLWHTSLGFNGFWNSSWVSTSGGTFNNQFQVLAGGVGISGKKKFVEWFWLQADLGWTRRGYKVTLTSDVNLDYLEIPVFARFQTMFGMSFLYAMAGPNFQFKLNSPSGSGYKSFVLGMDIAAGIEQLLSDNWAYSFEARFHTGLTKAFDNAGASFRNFGFGLGFGIHYYFNDGTNS